jgi:hypothetical protein
MKTISIAEYRNLIGTSKNPSAKNKFHSQKTKHGELVFDSKFESQRYADLLLMEKAGIISNLKRQVKYPLFINDSPVTTRAILKNGAERLYKLSYVADFVYQRDENEVVEDTKGFDTPHARLKRAVCEKIHGFTILIVRKPTKPRKSIKSFAK